VAFLETLDEFDFRDDLSIEKRFHLLDCLVQFVCLFFNELEQLGLIVADQTNK